MKALVWKEDGTIQPELKWPQPVLGDDEVLVEIRAVGVCMTDIHMVRGTLDFAKPPWILGHEMSGTVYDTGSKVSGWSKGERVVVDPVVTCGSCKYCQSGKKYLCESGGELGTTYGNGGYGQYVVVKPSNLYRLPENLSFEEGAMMEPLNCTLGAIERVDELAGRHVLIFGPGPAGLLFLQLAKAYGALDVTLVGTSQERLELGSRLGADKTINIKEEDLEQIAGDQTFDVVIEASGNINAVRDGFQFAAKNGTVVLYGLNGSNEPSIPSDLIVSKDLTIVTCISAPLLWNKGIDLVAAGKINVKDMITHSVMFDDASSRLQELVHNQFKPVKMMISHKREEKLI